jgi:hypothetical protein
MGLPRVLSLLAALALVAGCGSQPVAAPPPPAPGTTAPAITGSRELPPSLAIAHLRHDAARKAARERRRVEALAVARRSRTVGGALRRARLARHITREEHDRLRAQYDAARRSLGRLSGVRRVELASVVGAVDALAASRRLTAGRFAPVFLVLRRNHAFWTRAPLPAAGSRRRFGRDPAVFQYYPGRGIQLQPLASWGRVNARLGACMKPRRRAQSDLVSAIGVRARRAPCPRARLRRSLDRLVELGARRDRFVAWEYYFSHSGGTPPWISGMAQGTAIQALARGSRVLKARRYRRVAVRALGAFRAPPPVGVNVAVPGGRHYLMYSFSPGLRILNGNLQAITGLRDLAHLGRSRAARVLYRHGERAARRAVGGFDTGAWSLYSESGREATLGYHQLVGSFLGNLCERTHGRTYCSAHRRFARYEREPPRIRLARVERLRARHATSVRFTLSKLASVDVRVTSPRGVTMARRLELTRGSYTLPWTPPRGGRYRVRIAAQGPSGPRGVRAATVRVVQPKPKAKPRPKKDARPKPEPRPKKDSRPDPAPRKKADPTPTPQPEDEVLSAQSSRPGIAPLRKASTKRR